MPRQIMRHGIQPALHAAQALPAEDSRQGGEACSKPHRAQSMHVAEQVESGKGGTEPALHAVQALFPQNSRQGGEAIGLLSRRCTCQGKVCTIAFRQCRMQPLPAEASRQSGG